MSTPTPDAAASPRGRAGGPGRVDPEAALVEKLRREEPDAPEQLVATFGDRVYRLAIRITGNEQDAEEVAQDALWTAARKIHTFKGESAFGSWLYRITANTAYQKLRARQGKKQRGLVGGRCFPRFDEQGQHFDPWQRLVAPRPRSPRCRSELREVLSSGHRRPAGGLPDRVPHARRRGPVEPRDRRDAGHQPARGEVAGAPLAPVPAPAALGLSEGGLTGPLEAGATLTCGRGRVV